MTTLTISRTGHVRSPANKEVGLWDTISLTCKQFFDEVDIDHTRNQIKNLLTKALFPRRNEITVFRSRVHKEYGKKSWWLLLWYEVERYLRNARQELPAFQRTEKILLAALVSALLVLIVSSNTPAQGISRTFSLSDLLHEESSSPRPQSWLSGEATFTGSKAAVMAAYEYATVAGYSFVGNSADREALVSSGALVKLDSNYIELHDVSEPYTLPAVAQFVDRLGELHASRGCGKLVVTSALRTLAHQSALANGSNYSVHPSGMSVDLRRPTDEKSFCGAWLKNTLLEIEADGRIDMTAENAPRHYHVVVLPNEYNRWLSKQPHDLDPEVKWLATALHFEGGPDESIDGYRAIGWVIKNRVRSEDFPNTVVEVVAEGAAGRSAGGCQFSFMCDGRAEKIETPCAQSSETISSYQYNLCLQRWNLVVDLAKQILTETVDPTNGAVLYYATWMEESPHWAQPRREKRGDGSTITLPHGDFAHKPLEIGNHFFGCSQFRGNKACEV